MIVRCGRCGIELEVAGPGEFACPSCGTRNAVRSGASPSPFDLPDLGRTPPPLGADQPTNVNWISCPACRYRFVVGDVDEVSCPTCNVRLKIDEGTATEISA